MPNILDPNPETSTVSVAQANYPYKYPLGLNLRPDSDLHKKLVGEIMTRARESRASIQNRYESWNRIDETLTAYIDLTDKEQDLVDSDANKPVSIVVPVMYATLETLLTYLVAAFLEDPIFRYEGVGSEDVLGAMLLEQVIGVQTRKAKIGIQLHTMFRDSLAYGFGVAAPIWTVKEGYRTVAADRGFFSRFGNFIGTGRETRREKVIKYEGNELYNVDPYHYLPDPNVAVQDVQRGEYVGWIRSENRMGLLSQEENDFFFNCKYLKHITGTSTLALDQSKRDKDGVNTNFGGSGKTQKVDVIYMYIKLIPKEWGIGNNTYPEKWMFALAGDKVIIAAQPMDLDHDMFPVAICSPDFDGYSVSPISRLETVYGLQKLVNFLYNSHVANVRKAINDMFIVDPEVVNLMDVMRPSAGKVIRKRKKAWGKDIKGVEQLKVEDVTRGHLSEASAVAYLMDMATGGTDILKGAQRQTSERVSATEFQGTKGAALSRLEKSARISSLQAIVDLGYMFASHTQQYMSEDLYIKIAGRYEEELRERFGDVERQRVGPLDLLINYDVSIHDGSLPTSGDPTAWAAIFQVVASNPLMMQQFDVVKIFQHWATLSGAKNINDFVMKGGGKNIRVAPQEEIDADAQSGNIIPMGGAQGG